MTLLTTRALEPAIVLHLLGAVLAVVLGVCTIAARKGTPFHRLVGRAWVAAMVLAAASSFLISARLMPLQTALGTFGPIHLLSVIALWQLYRAVAGIRRGDLVVHRRAMVATFASLVIAGGFAMSPDRIVGGWLISIVG